MNKSVSAILVLMFAVSNAFAGNYYVSPKGSDQNDGSKDKPLATINKAKQLVQDEIEKGMAEDIRVVIENGTYQLNEPLVFGPCDGGNQKYLVSYEVAENEKPVISGGKFVKGWKKDEGGLWCAEIAEVKNGHVWFRSLYKDGERLTRSREPDNDYYKVKTKPEDFKHIELDQKLEFGSFEDQNAEMVLIVNWSINRGLIETIDANTVVTKTSMGRFEHPWTSPHVGKSVFLEHAFEFTDEPGEWYLDKKSGKLYYMAQENENPNEHEFVFPSVKQLIAIEGTQKEKIENIHFKGLSFKYCSWQLPEDGYVAVQAGYYGYLNDGKNDDTYCLPAAVKIKYAQNSSVELCEISHTSASAVSIGAACDDVTIEGCEIFDIGATGVHVGHHDETLDTLNQDWKDKKDVPKSVKILNNYIHHCGQISWGAVGVFSAFADGTVVGHNLITDMPYTGISVGFSWSTKLTSQKNNKIRFNRINTVMTKLADGGAIYTLGYQPGTELVNNLIYDVQRWKFSTPTLHAWANNAFFFDAGSKDILIKDNIAFDLPSKTPVRFNENLDIGGVSNMAKGMEWKNNYFFTDITDADFPWDMASKAGLEDEYKNRIISLDAKLNMAPGSERH